MIKHENTDIYIKLFQKSDQKTDFNFPKKSISNENGVHVLSKITQAIYLVFCVYTYSYPKFYELHVFNVLNHLYNTNAHILMFHLRNET